jgi:hypothetical protein
MPADDITFTLTFDEFQCLLLSMGFAFGSAMQQNDPRLAYSFLHIANQVNKSNPHWKPYVIPDQFKSTMK